jgi:hypothetical protein
VSSSAVTVKPVLVVVAAMVLMMTSWLVSGRPRQFLEMKLNSRCSILFHLEVPGQCRCLTQVTIASLVVMVLFGTLLVGQGAGWPRLVR